MTTCDAPWGTIVQGIVVVLQSATVALAEHNRRRIKQVHQDVPDIVRGLVGYNPYPSSSEQPGPITPPTD